MSRNDLAITNKVNSLSNTTLKHFSNNVFQSCSHHCITLHSFTVHAIIDTWSYHLYISIKYMFINTNV